MYFVKTLFLFSYATQSIFFIEFQAAFYSM